MKHFIQINLKIGIAAFFAVNLFAVAAFAQTTAFTYQGRLTDGAAASGTYQMQFALFDAVSGGAQIGSTLTFDGNAGNPAPVSAADGIFTVRLDFSSSPFSEGADRFLEIRVKKPSDVSYTTLTPRQPLTSSPYSIRSLSAATADNLTATGSGNFIQNTTAQQASSDFNISGDGTAGGTLSGSVVNAGTQYNLGGQRVLSAAGLNNLFAGAGAGANNTTGNFNSFFGASAGAANTTTGNNSFFGAFAGASNTGVFNSFFGAAAGGNNTTGQSNSFFGVSAGQSNTTGTVNAFFGRVAGGANTTGNGNSFFGVSAGQGNTTGGNNTLFGTGAGTTNTTGGNNTVIGANADVGANNLNFATAVGAGANVTASNTIVLGRSDGSDTVVVPGLGAAGGTQLCRNAANQISICTTTGGVLPYATVTGGTTEANAGTIPNNAAVVEATDNGAAGAAATVTLPAAATNGTVIIVGTSDPDGAIVFGVSGASSYAFNANQSAHFTRVAGAWKFLP